MFAKPLPTKGPCIQCRTWTWNRSRVCTTCLNPPPPPDPVKYGYRNAKYTLPFVQEVRDYFAQMKLLHPRRGEKNLDRVAEKYGLTVAKLTNLLYSSSYTNKLKDYHAKRKAAQQAQIMDAEGED